MSPDAIHKVLVAQAERLNLPEAYKNDLLVHDKGQLVATETQVYPGSLSRALGPG
ncbi:MAG: hypothetical protein JO061_02230 [Acidobacteriaceae bacterium]|nr:hypothetical protein [Acidobacteriaceae bacterium]